MYSDATLLTIILVCLSQQVCQHNFRVEQVAVNNSPCAGLFLGKMPVDLVEQCFCFLFDLCLRRRTVAHNQEMSCKSFWLPC